MDSYCSQLEISTHVAGPPVLEFSKWGTANFGAYLACLKEFTYETLDKIVFTKQEEEEPKMGPC